MSRQDTPRFRSRVDDVAGLRIRTLVSEGGRAEGPPVVLVHGFVLTSAALMPLAERLAERFFVLVPKLALPGESERLGGVPSVVALAKALDAWLDALGLRRAAFVATSSGCQTLTALAVLSPARVMRLVLTSPTGDPSMRQPLPHMRRWLWNVPFERPAFLRVVAHDLKAHGLRAAYRSLERTLDDHIEERLPLVDAPALVIRGARDRVVSQRWAEEVARLLPRGRLAVLPSAGHALSFSRRDDLARIVVPFLEGGKAPQPQPPRVTPR